MTAYSYDFLIVGAGIVGLTTAMELKKRHPKSSIAVLEKESRPGLHASGRNSGVLHCGIYYASDTLKAKLCAKGAARMRAFAAEQKIACEHSGKVVIPTAQSDLATVERLLKNAAENGIRAEKMDAQGIKQIEPHAAPYEIGIYCPDTAVIDSLAVVTRLRELLEQSGVHFYWDCEIDQASSNWVSSKLGRFEFGFLINCAGAHADEIAKLFGLAKDYALVPFKGIYYKLRPESSGLVNSSIYPVPDINLPFLGVHLTRVISGDVYVGPTAIPALGRENYGLLSGIKLAESWVIAWRMLGLYWDNQQNFRAVAHAETQKYFKPSFLAAARKLVPELKSEDLVSTSKAGIRPQLVNLREKRLEMDYILERTQNSLHVLNAISPAFTSSFAFAELIVDHVQGQG